jgi:hypothetical protein
MKRMALMLVVTAGIAVAAAAPVAAAGSRVDRLHGIETVLAVRMEADFPVGSLMRADCSDVQFVGLPDGRGIETLRCQLSNVPVMIPAFQAVPPQQAFSNAGGPCEWTSDYWFAKTGAIVLATSYHYTVSASGQVHATAFYAAEPVACG